MTVTEIVNRMLDANIQNDTKVLINKLLLTMLSNNPDIEDIQILNYLSAQEILVSNNDIKEYRNFLVELKTDILHAKEQLTYRDFLDLDEDKSKTNTSNDINSSISENKDVESEVSKNEDEINTNKVNIPEKIPVLTGKFKNAFRLNEDDSAFLAPVSFPIGTNGLNFNSGKLYFAGQETRSVLIKDLQSKQILSDADDFDLPFINCIYSIIFQHYMQLAKKSPYNFTELIALPIRIDLNEVIRALKIQKRADTIEKLRYKIMSYNRLIGVMNVGTKKEQNLPVMLYYGEWDETKYDQNFVPVVSPYLMSIATSIYREYQNEAKNYAAGFLEMKYNGVIHADIFSTRSKKARDFVFVIVELITSYNSLDFEISTIDLLKRDKVLYHQYLEKTDSKKKNKFLNSLFRKAEELIQENTDIPDIYPNFKMPISPSTTTIEEKLRFY